MNGTTTRRAVLCRLVGHRWRWVYDLHIAEGQANPPGHYICPRCWRRRPAVAA